MPVLMLVLGTTDGTLEPMQGFTNPAMQFLLGFRAVLVAKPCSGFGAPTGAICWAGAMLTRCLCGVVTCDACCQVCGLRCVV
jgi:hypothetical protein